MERVREIVRDEIEMVLGKQARRRGPERIWEWNRREREWGWNSGG